MVIESLAKQSLEKHFWNWQGHQICYTTAGAGQPIVLIHGFGASIGHWRKNIPVLAAAGYQVYALDLLGLGASDKPLVPYSVELWQALLSDFYQTHINTPAIWVGNSIGGLLALSMLADFPEMAQGGVLLNAAGGLSHRPDELNLPLRLMMGAFNQAVRSPFGALVFNQVRRKSNIRRSLRQVYRDAAAVTDELVDMLYEPSCHPGAAKVFASIITAPPGPSPIELLPKVKSPLLVIWGEADPWTPIDGAKVYQEFAQQHPVKVVGIPDTGHCPHDERPEAVNALILEWLEELNS